MIVDHLIQFKISPWSKTAGFCTRTTDGLRDGRMDRPSYRNTFLTDASRKYSAPLMFLQKQKKIKKKATALKWPKTQRRKLTSFSQFWESLTTSQHRRHCCRLTTTDHSIVTSGDISQAPSAPTQINKRLSLSVNWLVCHALVQNC